MRASLAALCLLLARSTDGLLRKCCPQGEALFLPERGEGYECRPSPHEWTYGAIEFGLEEGCRVEYADRDTEASCIDNLEGKDRVVGLYCDGSNDTFPVPEVHYLGKCCPANRTYDSRLQTCWGDQPDSWPTPFLNVLMFGAGRVIDIRTGAPDCMPYQVVVDHLVLSRNVHRRQSASISFILDEKEYVMNPDEICVDRTELRDVFIVRVCEDQNIACQKQTCIRKCCQEGKSFYENNNCTYDLRHHVRPMRMINISDGGREPVEFRTPAYWYGGMECNKYIDGSRDDFTLTTDGRIFNTIEETWTDAGVFCVEHAKAEKEFDEYVFICFPDDDPEPEIHIWATMAMIVSSFFLLLTLLVYALLPSLKNLHGKTLMCHVLSLLVAYVTLAVVRLITDYLLYMLCICLGYITIFSFLASFFWLNVISFDIWWTFGSMRPVLNRKKREWRRFLLYSLYAWGGPSLITGSVFLADNDTWIPEVVRPGIGTKSCWFTPTSNAVFLFFIGPVGVLMSLNLVFFILTVRHCARVKNDLDRVGHTPIADKKFKSDKSRLVMNTKLFVAMGINWGLEVWSAVFLPLKFLPNEIWYMSDMANACQGLVMFCIFVLKKRVMRELRVRLVGLLRLGKPPARYPSVSTLYNNNTTTSSATQDIGCHVMKKSISESKLSPLPQTKKDHKNLNKKSQSSNRLLV